MLSMLPDRFQLKFHTATKEGRAYALMLSGKGPKLSEPKDPNAFRVASGWTGKADRPAFMQRYNASMPRFTARLSEHFRCPVLDQTGLKGDFDFRFEYAPDETQPDAAGPSFFTAFQDQLGLKLVTAKASVEVLVIDHAEKPSEN
jgi:uncharacterized protein (TIGR03435 family)